MPACVPVNNNNVGDVNSDAKPAGNTDSKLSKIISCLFLRKKTDVVDMTKESGAAAKKQKLSVDRSERSRRVLKMESMRTVPKSRDGTETQTTISQGQNQMFLPSESPTASFLSYLNPSVRRACSEVIRTNNAPSNNKLSREAFTESRRKLQSRNTNYRGQQISQNGKKSVKDQNGMPPKPPDRQTNKLNEPRKPIVVPGIMTSSDDDIGYNSDNEISDLHDEMRRMNLSQPDLRSTNTKTRKREGEHSDGSWQEEGSISLSEGSDVDENDPDDRERPQNPSPTGSRDKTQPEAVKKQQSMEDVIDNIFQQTQQNIDTIYKNGLENMDLETYRSDTITPDTYMKRLEEDHLRSQPDEQASREPEPRNSKGDKENGKCQIENQSLKNDATDPHLDNLLTEVSIWAQDRQKWLLDGEQPGIDSNTRETTAVSMTTDGRAIEQVKQSNRDKCNEWVNETSTTDTDCKTNSEPKASGLLTGPKLFRSTSKTPTSQTMSFGMKSKCVDDTTQKQSKKSDGGLTIVDLGKETVEEEHTLPDIDTDAHYPEPWTSDMYTSTPLGGPMDRATVDDNLSELNDSYHFRARSPDSWLSSTGSCSNLINKTVTSISEVNDGFEMSPTPTTEREAPVKITASNVGKSHQIMRLTPKVHAPFRGLDRQVTPMPVEPNPIPTKPMLRNTQLKPLTLLRAAKQNGSIDTFPTLPGRKSFGSYRSVNNPHDDSSDAAKRALRPFSEIPLRTEVSDNDRNSSLLMHSSSVREARDYQAQTSVAQTTLRPVSETLPAKRIDKIGFGPIMATKEKQMYARDVMNAMEKHRLQPQNDAFLENASAPANEPLIEYDDVEKEKETGRKRHTVFTNNLIRGGYSYDKHSRTRPSENRKELKSENGENVHFIPNLGSKNNNPATRSINDLSFDIRDSVDNPQSPRYSQNSLSQQQPLVNGNFPNIQANHKRSNVSQSFNVGSSQGADIKRGQHSNTSQSFHNKYSSVQSHGLGISPNHGLGLQDTYAPISGSQAQTASKFRQIRSRRDQEMDWLMRDAAETEV